MYPFMINTGELPHTLNSGDVPLIINRNDIPSPSESNPQNYTFNRIF